MAGSGRGWEEILGQLEKTGFPWDGASDIRNFYIDDLINDDVDIMRTADENCFMQALGTNSNNDSIAKAVTDVLAYVQRTWLAEELESGAYSGGAMATALRSSSCFGGGLALRDRFRAKDRHHAGSYADCPTGPAVWCGFAVLDAVGAKRPAAQPAGSAAGMQEFQQYFPQADPMQAFQQLMQTGQFSFQSALSES